MYRYMNMTRLFLAVVTAVGLLTSMGQAQAGVIADARGDYVDGTNDGDPGILPATGTGTWRYLDSATPNPADSGELRTLLWSAANNTYLRFTSLGSANAVDLLNATLTDYEIRVHPSGQNPQYAVVRWEAGSGEEGLINIAGNIRKVVVGGGGVSFQIYVEGALVFNTTLAFNDATGVSFNHSLSVGAGATVDFVIGPNGGDVNDSTGLKATITLAGLTKELSDDTPLAVELKLPDATDAHFDITYTPGPDDPEDVAIVDTVPAEWEVTSTVPSTGTADFEGANKKGNNKSATKILWNPDGEGVLSVWAETRGSPSGKGKHKPTSCGPLYLNDGAAAYEADEDGNPITDVEPFATSNALCLAAVKDLNGGGVDPTGDGDEDGDGASDWAEACGPVRTNPCNPDSDGDTFPDGADVCPTIAGTADDSDGDGILDVDEAEGQVCVINEI